MSSFVSVSSLPSSSSGRDPDPPSPTNYRYHQPHTVSKTICSGMSLSFSPHSTKSTPTRGWKPFSIRPPALISFILVSLALIAVIEYLAQESQKHGGLLLSASDEGSTGATFCTQYAPTIVAVLYSLTFTWIDLDIRRIQPWLELSRPEGAPADSTLLLDYPFEFLALIPLKSWKKKHWLVFYAGTVMVLIFWAVTPLQSAIFGTQSITITNQVSITESQQFVTLEQQLNVLDASVLNDAYAMTWLGQPLPPFTTTDRAFIPFQPVDVDSTPLPHETWTTTATAVSTDLDCWPAVTNKSARVQTMYTFYNGRSCTAQVELQTKSTSHNPNSTRYTVLYIGYPEDANLDYFLAGVDCNGEASHQFLAIWASTASEQVTAMFCQPSYRKQTVSVMVSAEDRRPQEPSVMALGEPLSLAETEFNSTAFEYLLATGLPSKEFRRDYPRDRILDQYSTISRRYSSLEWPTTNMVGFAMGQLNGSLADLQDPARLQAVFTAAHRLILSASMSQLLGPLSITGLQRPGTIQYKLYGVVVSRPISLVVECLLGVIALLVVGILVVSWRSQSNLLRDPGSIGATLTIFRESSQLLEEFADKDRYNDKSLEKSIQGNWYRLLSPGSFDTQGLRIGKLAVQTSTNPPHVQPATGDTTMTPMRHKALRPVSGVGFIATLFAGIALLVYLKSQEQHLGGLPRPSNNFEVLQLLENYVPTIFATLVEPFLVLLNRLRCLLQPFHDLRQGHRPAARTLETSYATLPPQLTILKAAKARHGLLAGLCGISLLANILAVALGALFNEQPVAVTYPTTFTQVQVPSLNRTDITSSSLSNAEFFDHFYVTMANLTYGTPLTPWADTDFAFFPFFTVYGDDNSSSTLTAPTRGFGMWATCSEIGTTPGSMPYVNFSINDDGSQDLGLLLRDTNGSITSCNPWQPPNQSDRLRRSANSTSGLIAMEMASSLRAPAYNQGIGGICEQHMLFSWMRVDPSDKQGTLKQAHVHCTAALRTAIFNVTVDQAGHVLESTRVGPFDNLTSISQNETQALLTSGVEAIGIYAAITASSTSVTFQDASWHNDTLTRDWFNYFLKLMSNGTSLVDPQQPLPDMNWTIPAVKGLYQRLFSAALGLNMDMIFKAAKQPIQLEGWKVVQETRIFMDDAAFIITIVILALNITIATILYVQESQPFLPRLPSSLGSLLAYGAASRAVRRYLADVDEVGGGRPQRHGGETYSFGEYVGLDGRAHVGVELDPFVNPVEKKGLSGLVRFRKK